MTFLLQTLHCISCIIGFMSQKTQPKLSNMWSYSAEESTVNGKCRGGLRQTLTMLPRMSSHSSLFSILFPTWQFYPNAGSPRSQDGCRQQPRNGKGSIPSYSGHRKGRHVVSEKAMRCSFTNNARSGTHAMSISQL